MGMNMITINKTNPIYLSNKKQSNKNEKTYSSIKPTSTSFGGNPLLSKKNRRIGSSLYATTFRRSSRI